MSLKDHPRMYGTAAVLSAFALGSVLTLGFKDFYPDLERRYQQSRKRSTRRSSATASSSDTVRRRSSLFFFTPVHLEDHESLPASPDPNASGPTIAETRLTGLVNGIEGCIGSTPLLTISSLSRLTGRTILAKAELLNPGGSPKDRVALSIITTAEASGLLRPHRGDTIYEGTVGSTGISLAQIARARGYACHIVMPDDQSLEKVNLLREMGAVVERVRPAPIADAGHFVNVARRRAKEHESERGDGSRGFFADQFESGANWKAHEAGTGREIVGQTGGKIDAFVCGAGTGGTITGVARALKGADGNSPPVEVEKYLTEGGKKHVRTVIADPFGSGLYNRIHFGVLYSTTEQEGTRRRTQVDTIVEGIGMNRMTGVLSTGLPLIDDCVSVSDEEACAMAAWLVRQDGIFAGSSSAVNVAAAVRVAMSLPEGSTIVTVLCDSGFRHLSKFYKKVQEEEEKRSKEGKGVGGEEGLGDLLELLGIDKRGKKLEA